MGLTRWGERNSKQKPWIGVHNETTRDTRRALGRDKTVPVTDRKKESAKKLLCEESGELNMHTRTTPLYKQEQFTMSLTSSGVIRCIACHGKDAPVVSGVSRLAFGQN